MKSQNLIKDLGSLPFFTKKSLLGLAKKYSLKDSSINTYISRYLKTKEIISLKRGLYLTTSFYENYRNKLSYLFYLSNILRTPSYVSSWTALQYYGLTTEAIRTVTCVTKKVTRDFKTKIGTFSYQSINKKLFKDFILKNEDFGFYIATPPKALFDLLYFRTNQFRGVSFGEIKILIESLRIDINEMSPKDREVFYKMVKEYTK